MKVGHYIASSLLFVGAVGEIELIHGSDAIIIMLFVGWYIISWNGSCSADAIIIMLFVGSFIIGWIGI